MAAAASSYRLESPRPRPPPVPIRTRSPSPASNFGGSKDRPQSLLYDLPPTSPLSPTYANSPVSPTRRSQSRTSRYRGMTPPPSHRAPTPSRPQEKDLESFADLCRAWYFNQDDDAGRAMTQTLATLPSSHRAPFSRLQASVRSAYHASVNARRNAEFQAQLAATVPGASLTAHARAEPHGPLARKERLERFERFVRTWCTMGMPGTKPFFEGLWALMRLSVVPEHLGGAGSQRIEWEIDDAVFKEAAGKDFMLESIDVLKGVLGFEEVMPSKRSASLNGVAPYSPFSPLSPIHSRSQSTPLPSDVSIRPRSNKPPPIASTTTRRPRAPSDPFLDTHMPQLSTSYSSANTMGQLSTSGSSAADEPSCPPTPQAEVSDPFRPSSNSNGLDFDGEEEYMRIWIAPDLANVEYLALLKVFPSFVVRTPMPRFPVTKPPSPRDIEEGGSVEDQRNEIRVGTGKMWVGTQARRPGWQGSWWTRLKSWLKTLFC